jgi:hypothetical protein
LKKAYDSVRREVLHNILIEFGVPTTAVEKRTRNTIDGEHNTARRNTHMLTRETLYQQININAERQHFPQPHP